MSRKKTTPFTPSPEYEAAYQRVIETAHLCAAKFLDEQPVEDPAAQASPDAISMAMGMLYFLLRLEVEDLRMLASEGGIHDLYWKPFRPEDVVKKRKGQLPDCPIVQ